jgi:flagellum-specific peptidoglycan hydrolase FlgJ
VNQVQLKFLAEIAPAAIEAQATYGVPKAVTMAQAILESSNKNGWGQSSLALLANNFFGIKASDLGDPETYIEMPTAEYEAGKRVMVEADFRRYTTPYGSFADHARLLAMASRYAPAMAVKADPMAFCDQVMECGYSTNRPPLATTPPFYADTLKKLITECGLLTYGDAPQ